ncbi:MAG TPA: PH domain-containing protein [Blastocatellia bacterium]|nr:PH domain-containing protein [Blastocatellia bacterium]
MQSEPLAASIFEGRLHPLTIAFSLLKAAKGIIPALPVLLFSNKIQSFMLLTAIVGTSIATSLARYFSFTYRIEGNELITQQGILGRKQRSIPLERIQEIRVEQGVLHRVFDVVDAKIETGGGGGAEASLSVLSRAEVERLRRTVFEHAAKIRTDSGFEDQSVEAPVAAAPERVVIRRLGLKDLILIGLTTNHIISALALAGALWNFAEDLLPGNFYQRAGETLYRESSRFFMRDTALVIALAVAGALAVILIGVIFSTIAAIIRFYGFTLSLSGEDLHRRYGLLTRRSSSLPRRRIQVLKIEEKLFRRMFGLATLRADTSGSHRDNEDDDSGRDVLLPITRRGAVNPLLTIFFPDFDAGQTESVEWRRVSRIAIRRGVIKGAVFCALAAASLFAAHWRLAALWPLALLPLVYFISVANYRNLGYALSERYFCARRGWVGRSTHIVPINKVQAVEVRQSPFDRRLGLATLSVDTAGQAYTGGGPQISNLPLDEARAIANTIAHKASATHYIEGRRLKVQSRGSRIENG